MRKAGHTPGLFVDALAPPPAKAGGGWEGVPTVRGDARRHPSPTLPCLRRGGRKKLAAEAAPTGARRGPPYSAASAPPMLPRLYIPERAQQPARRMPGARVSQAERNST